MSHQAPPQRLPQAFIEDPEVRDFITELVRAVYLNWAGFEKHVGFYGTDPKEQGAALTAALTSLTHTSPGTPDYAIQDLISTTPFGFASKDEGNTVLSVILNLQTRVNELEARLDATTGIGVIA